MTAHAPSLPYHLLSASIPNAAGNLIRSGDLRGYRSMAKMYTILHATGDAVQQ